MVILNGCERPAAAASAPEMLTVIEPWIRPPFCCGAALKARSSVCWALWPPPDDPPPTAPDTTNRPTAATTAATAMSSIALDVAGEGHLPTPSAGHGGPLVTELNIGRLRRSLLAALLRRARSYFSLSPQTFSSSTVFAVCAHFRYACARFESA